MQSFDLILTSAGKSTRFNSNEIQYRKKECCLINKKSVLSLALTPFLSFACLKNVVITYPAGYEEEIRSALSSLEIPENVSLYFVEGGKNRTQSVRNAALFLLSKNTTSSFIAVHDGARPFVKRELIEKILENAERYSSSVPAVSITDAVKRVDDKGFITESLDKNTLIRVQTPQIFEREKFLSLYSSFDDDASYQDDAEPFVINGGRCHITEGDEENRKITYMSDIQDKEIRIGFGNDIHRLEEGRKLYLGGIVLPHTKGEVAHSDGDVLIHALIDALLGASAMGDIGHFFPPEDNKWKDSDSRTLLSIILGRVNKEIINIDSTITLEGFKLAPYITKIRESLCSLLSIDTSRINVKAKTNEGLDSLGHGDAIKAEVVVLLK